MVETIWQHNNDRGHPDSNLALTTTPRNDALLFIFTGKRKHPPARPADWRGDEDGGGVLVGGQAAVHRGGQLLRLHHARGRQRRVGARTARQVAARSHREHLQGGHSQVGRMLLGIISWREWVEEEVKLNSSSYSMYYFYVYFNI